MFEISVGEVLSYFWGEIADRGPFFVSVAVGVIAYLQWRTNQQAVKVSEDVASLTRMQHETNQIAVEIAADKRNDDLFDRRVQFMKGYINVIVALEHSSIFDDDLMARFYDDEGMTGSYLFDAGLAIDISRFISTLGEICESKENRSNSGLGPRDLVKQADELDLQGRMSRKMALFNVPTNPSDDTDEIPPASS